MRLRDCHEMGQTIHMITKQMIVLGDFFFFNFDWVLDCV